MGKTFQAVNPATGKAIDPVYQEATAEEVDQALSLAQEAFIPYRSCTVADRAAFLAKVADEIEALGDALIDRAGAETGLPEGRLVGERGRTVNQMRMFADLITEGSWVEARIDLADPERKPFPKPDLRRILVPMGPVAVFGASNFPLAFSVCGGDTASALAAGNPVVVKAHPSHPGTCELMAQAVRTAIKRTGMHEGVFSMVQGTGHEVGLNLVRHPATQAVGFTGSLRAGRALMEAAAARPVPIPVYAEMGSVNPVFIMPDALKDRGAAIAKGLVGSMTLGVGQFCTQPGVVVGLSGDLLDTLITEMSEHVRNCEPGTLLNAGICRNFCELSQKFESCDGVQLAAKSDLSSDTEKTQAPAMLFTTAAATFLDTDFLREEMFGPSTLIVKCGTREELCQVARSIPGSLTATIHATSKDLDECGRLIEVLVDKAGRLIFNGYPTGVEVSSAMHHGGPYPSTSDSRSTSVGTAAIQRFARPVSYQDTPESILPDQLKNQNSQNIWRLIDGELTKSDC